MDSAQVPRSLYRPVRARHPAEPGGQTSLELLFDLAFATASGFAAMRLTELLHSGVWAQAVLGFAMVFFAIWWGWLNFSWFSSAYDTDDGLTWALTTVQILGAATLAAGVPAAVAEHDFTVITVGYAVMRLPLAVQWCRAAGADPPRRATCLKFAAGLLVLQACWLGRLALPDPWALRAFAVLAVLELAVPAWAQRGAPIRTHPAHLAGRYGRFTLTVAAQVIAATVHAIQLGVSGSTPGAVLLVAVIGAVSTVCVLWLYYSLPHARLAAGRFAPLWEYGHYAIVGPIGVLGGAARYLADRASASPGDDLAGLQRWDAFPLALAVAATLLAMWVVCIVPAWQELSRWSVVRFPLGFAVVMLLPLVVPVPLAAAAGIGLALLAVVATTSRAR
ncbi:low temperature requirement protein A [Haloechinothrix sp. YIM 98757]|uniref:Low temperature requirement protein A n=1 Tax=Haloechinothrix aidingensis TaxID=2752311 RepID=A0A838ACZ4_9PSEU|nr:low temperature requirement protein A [Haloechinothrix aidingensis]